MLEDAVQKMIEFGSLDPALSLVTEFKSRVSVQEDSRSLVCSNLAKIVIEEGLKGFTATPTSASLEDLFLLLPGNCPLMTERFVANVLTLDVRKTIIPFFINVARGIASDNSPISIGKLAAHCARKLTKRAFAPIAKVQSWSINETTPFPNRDVI